MTPENPTKTANLEERLRASMRPGHYDPGKRSDPRQPSGGGSSFNEAGAL